MSRLTDSTSDSDSNSSTSWIFVDESNADNEEANKYYLNCSSEPVQELTEKCLNSAGSEIETDSDGISVISESDSGKQILQNDDLGNSSEEMEKEMGMEVIKTVGHYVSQMEKTNIKLTSEYRNSFMWYVIFTIVLVLALIVPLFLSDDELIVKNSLNDFEPEIDKNNLDMPTMVFDDAPSLGDCHIDVNSELGSFDDVKTNEERKKFTHKNGKSYDFSNEKRNEKVYSNKQIKFDKKLGKNEKKKKHYDDYKDNNNNNMKDEYKNQQYYDKEIKKRQSQLKKLEKSVKKKEKELNKMKRQLKNLKSKINEELNFLHVLKKSKYKEKMRFNKKKYFLNAKIFNASLVGDWYYNLYDERDKIRKQEQMANWVFDRAEMRSRKRDKAFWYFNWMTDREQLRFKKDFKQFSY